MKRKIFIIGLLLSIFFIITGFQIIKIFPDIISTKRILFNDKGTSIYIENDTLKIKDIRGISSINDLTGFVVDSANTSSYSYQSGNANLLDSLNSTQFLRSDTVDTFIELFTGIDTLYYKFNKNLSEFYKKEVYLSGDSSQNLVRVSPLSLYMYRFVDSVNDSTEYIRKIYLDFSKGLSISNENVYTTQLNNNKLLFINSSNDSVWITLNKDTLIGHDYRGDFKFLRSDAGDTFSSLYSGINDQHLYLSDTLLNLFYLHGVITDTTTYSTILKNDTFKIVYNYNNLHDSVLITHEGFVSFDRDSSNRYSLISGDSSKTWKQVIEEVIQFHNPDVRLYRKGDTLYFYDYRGEVKIGSGSGGSVSDTSLYSWVAHSVDTIVDSSKIALVSDSALISNNSYLFNTYPLDSFYKKSDNIIADSSIVAGTAHLAYNSDSLNHIEANKYILNTDTVVYSDTSFYAINTSIPDSAVNSAYSWTSHSVDTLVDSAKVALNSNQLEGHSSSYFYATTDTVVYSDTAFYAITATNADTSTTLGGYSDTDFWKKSETITFADSSRISGHAGVADTSYTAGMANNALLFSNYPTDSFWMKHDNIIADSSVVTGYSYTSHLVDTIVDSAKVSLNTNLLNSLSSTQFIRSDIPDTGTYSVWDSLYTVTKVKFGTNTYIFNRGDSLFGYDTNGEYYLNGGGGSSTSDTVKFAWNTDSLSHYPVDSFLLKSDNIPYVDSADVSVNAYNSYNSDSLGGLTSSQFLRSDVTDTLTKLVFGSSYFIQDTVRSGFLLGLNDTVYLSSDKSIYYAQGNTTFKSTKPLIIARPVSNRTMTISNYTGGTISWGMVTDMDVYYRSLVYVSVNNSATRYVSAGDSLFLTMDALCCDIFLLPNDTLKNIFGDTIMTINLEGTAYTWELYWSKVTYLDDDTIIELISSPILEDTVDTSTGTTFTLLKSDLDTTALNYVKQNDGSIFYRFYLKALSDYADFNYYSYKLYFSE